MGDNAKALQMVKAAPPMTAEELEKINATFKTYIFRVRRKREIWTTCCGRHEVVAAQDATDEINAVLEAEHWVEPRGYGGYGCHCGYMSAPPPKPQPERVPCPYCGKMARVKELGRTGNRLNLAEPWHRAVVLRWYRGALWARAYEVGKRYGHVDCLTEKPNYSLLRVYRFKPGEVCHVSRWWEQCPWDAPVKAVVSTKNFPMRVSEPYRWNSEYGMGYDLIGAEEIEKSPFRYCGFEQFEKNHGDSSMRFLALCTAYPRQVEMLMKAGMHEAVADFVQGRRKNTAAFSWEEVNPLKAFGLDKHEMADFVAGKKNLECLTKYKQLRRAGICCGMSDTEELHSFLPGSLFTRVVAKLKKNKLPPEKFLHYLNREREAENGKGKRKSLITMRTAVEWWNDYIDAAEVLGLNLANSVFLTPKGLKAKHDKATKAALTILTARRNTEASQMERELLQKLAKRYTYSDGRWLIRPPLGANEIVAEGKALKHCVGGYADRHASGKLAILFLRDRENPRKPLVTIEMHGNQLVQIHGYDDERTACKENPKRIPPRELYAEFLEPWMAWVQSGSKRDKKGRPIVRTEKKKKEANVA